MRHIHGRHNRFRLFGVRFGALFALVCGALLPGLAGSAGATGTCNTTAGSTICTFGYTGAAQTWTVPDGVTQVTLDVFGAQGGYESAQGGNGGRATATVAVTPGETLTIVVGGVGHSPFSGGDALGGFNGGGNGGAPYNLPAAFYGSGGGGASDVRIGGTDLAHRVIVAGGGGGAADEFGPSGTGSGGAGGGLSGGTGGTSNTDCSLSSSCAPSGGAGGNQDGTTGSGQLGQGSNGADNTSTLFNGVGAGGGGGGYFGGAGGSAGTGGGGGSGFGPAGTTFATGVPGGDGQVVVTFTPPDATPSTTTIALAPAAPDGSNGWYIHQPTVTVSAVDNAGGSGVAETRCVLDPASVPGTFADLPATPCPYLGAGAAVADGVHTVYAASVDNAGNAESPVRSASFQVDTTPPTLSPSLANGTVFVLGAPAPIISPNASDPAPPVGPGPASGIASASCGAVSTATVGTRSVSCTATDKAGNTTTVSQSYTVAYQFVGFLVPLGGGTQTPVFKAGSTIPLKFQLTDASGAVVQASSAPIFAMPTTTSCAAGAVDASGTTDTGDTGNTFRWDSTAQQYIYNYHTARSLAGMCQTFTVTL
ncbi:MAG TPA: PxKF domain-containing protein, partial [Thermomicrobiales bacterium]|nr:PxKF domain-containing protein [Thermomicrobiales bacterium]